MDQDKDGVLNYQEFKNGFKKLMEITRIRNVIKEIQTIKNDESANLEHERSEEIKKEETENNVLNSDEKNENSNEENNSGNKDENKEEITNE